MSTNEMEKHREGMKPDQDLVIAGFIGLSGLEQILEKKEETLSEHFAKWFIDSCKAVCRKKAPADKELFLTAGAVEYEAVGEGGIMAALWKLFEEYGLGFEIDLKEIPICQETIEVCEIFDINPYRLQSEGCVLLTAENGRDLVKYLEKKGIYGVVIGKVEAGIKRQILNGAVRTFLDRPKRDELYKIN